MWLDAYTTVHSEQLRPYIVSFTLSAVLDDRMIVNDTAICLLSNVGDSGVAWETCLQRYKQARPLRMLLWYNP